MLLQSRNLTILLYNQMTNKYTYIELLYNQLTNKYIYTLNSTRYLQLNSIKITIQLIPITKKALYFLSPHMAGLLCLPGLNTSQRFRYWCKSCRGSRWDGQWGKPASVRSTATGCQLPKRLPPS